MLDFKNISVLESHPDWVLRRVAVQKLWNRSLGRLEMYHFFKYLDSDTSV